MLFLDRGALPLFIPRSGSPQLLRGPAWGRCCAKPWHTVDVLEILDPAIVVVKLTLEWNSLATVQQLQAYLTSRTFLWQQFRGWAASSHSPVLCLLPTQCLFCLYHMLALPSSHVSSPVLTGHVLTGPTRPRSKRLPWRSLPWVLREEWLFLSFMPHCVSSEA